MIQEYCIVLQYTIKKTSLEKDSVGGTGKCLLSVFEVAIETHIEATPPSEGEATPFPFNFQSTVWQLLSFWQVSPPIETEFYEDKNWIWAPFVVIRW